MIDPVPKLLYRQEAEEEDPDPVHGDSHNVDADGYANDPQRDDPGAHGGNLFIPPGEEVGADVVLILQQIYTEGGGSHHFDDECANLVQTALAKEQEKSRCHQENGGRCVGDEHSADIPVFPIIELCLPQPGKKQCQKEHAPADKGRDDPA